jgi:hypothetical protein
MVFPWLMPQAYGRLFILQRDSEGFFTASVSGLHLSSYGDGTETPPEGFSKAGTFDRATPEQLVEYPRGSVRTLQ